MGRVKKPISALSNAKDDIRKLLRNNPIKTGVLLEGLGYDSVNFDASPHQLALHEMIGRGEVQWWRDVNLNVLYGMSGTMPDWTGDDVVAEFFGKIHQIIPEFDAEPDDELPCTLFCDKQQIAIEVEYDKLTLYSELDWHHRTRVVEWPVSDYPSLAQMIRQLGKWSINEVEMEIRNEGYYGPDE